MPLIFLCKKLNLDDKLCKALKDEAAVHVEFFPDILEHVSLKLLGRSTHALKIKKNERDLVVSTIKSVIAGDYDKVEECINAGVDLEILESKHNILAMVAEPIPGEDEKKQKERIKIMKLFLDEGVKAKSMDLYHLIVFTRISEDNMNLLLELLIEKGGAEIGEIWTNGALNPFNPLVAAIQHNRMGVFDFLVQKVEELDDKLCKSLKDEAAVHVEFFPDILEHVSLKLLGRSTHALKIKKNERDLVVSTIKSVIAGDYDKVEECINAGVDLEILESKHNILAMVAEPIPGEDEKKQKERIKIMKLFLDEGVKAKSMDLYHLIVFTRISEDNMNLLLELLIEKGGAEIGEIWTNGALNPFNPLVAAIQHNRMGVFDFLVQKVEELDDKLCKSLKDEAAVRVKFFPEVLEHVSLKLLGRSINEHSFTNEYSFTGENNRENNQKSTYVSRINGENNQERGK